MQTPTDLKLEARDLVKRYGDRTVVRGVSLEVRPGEVVGLLGPNGAGKTTTFYMVVGVEAPDAGRIHWWGQDVSAMPMHRRARKGIGYLPQESSVFRGLTVWENLMALAELLPLSRGEQKDRCEGLLEEFHLHKVRDTLGMSLSGGERRRCEMARALVTQPRIMLLDEPFAGVDPKSVLEIQDLIADLKQRGIGVLITDHNVRETLQIADRAYILADGMIMKHGLPNEIAEDPDIRRVVLGRSVQARLMAMLGPNLSQRLTQSQTLALTPAMQLKLKLWQMNLLELSQNIEHELQENPLLELVEDGDEVPSLEALEEGRDSEVADLPTQEGVELPEGADTVELGPLPDDAREMDPAANLEAFTEEGVSQVQETEMGAENAWDTDLPRTSSLPEDERTSWEDRLTGSETLQEHLRGQLYQLLEVEDPRAIQLERVIDHVDPKGYLRLDPDQSVETTLEALAAELKLMPEHLQTLVDILQEFDPSGVGCFTVSESLLLQLRHAGAEPDDLAVTIIREHAELLEQRDSAKLRKTLGCSEEELAEALSVLRHLHPAPGRAFDPEGERVVKPDVVALKGEDGIWKVYLNDEGLPRLRVSGDYRHFLSSAEAKGDKDFIRDRYRSARDFIRGVEDRNRTVLRVAAAIVDLQMDFLEQGVEGLRPMVLRDVAERTGFHESTISRVVKAKSIHTPQGLFDLNYFFSAGLGSASGDDVSATVVKHRIKALVQGEDPAKPLSDEAIARILERDGIKVARRTVNKYREELKIPPASRRRRR